MVILLVDPAAATTGLDYQAAVRDLGSHPVSLFTGLSRGATMPDGDPALRVDGVDDALRQIRAAGYPVEAVVPANGTSLHVADEIAAALGLPGNDPALGLARRHKAAMRDHAAAAGVRVPAFRVVHSHAEIAEAAREIGPPVIVKQTMGTGSYGVSVLGDPDALRDLSVLPAVDMLGRPVTEWLVEKYVRGQEYAVNVYSAAGEHRLVDIWEYRRPDDRDYDFPLWDIVQIGPEHPDHARVEDFVRPVLDAFGVRWGPSHIEVKRDRDTGEIYLIELAARLSGGPAVTLWARHSDLRPYHDAVECHLGRRPPVIGGDHGFRAVLGSVVFRNDDAPGTLVAVHGLDELAALPGVADVEVGFRAGDTVPVTRDNLHLPLSATVHGPDRESVLHTVELARKTVRLEMAPNA